MAKPFIPQILTGNDLRSGDVVFRADAGVWDRDLQRALVAHTAEDASTLLKTAVADSGIRTVSLELIDVALTETGLVPLHIRERIRVSGPTVQSDFRV